MDYKNAQITKWNRGSKRIEKCVLRLLYNFSIEYKSFDVNNSLYKEY